MLIKPLPECTSWKCTKGPSKREWNTNSKLNSEKASGEKWPTTIILITSKLQKSLKILICCRSKFNKNWICSCARRSYTRMSILAQHCRKAESAPSHDRYDKISSSTESGKQQQVHRPTHSCRLSSTNVKSIMTSTELDHSQNHIHIFNPNEGIVVDRQNKDTLTYSSMKSATQANRPTSTN
jgi:hypothetical protein